MKNKVMLVTICLLIVSGLAFMGCEGPGCIGTGQCTVTIGQGSYGLYVDNNVERSTCGSRATWNSNSGSYTGGCNVQNNIDDRNRKAGRHNCDC